MAPEDEQDGGEAVVVVMPDADDTPDAEGGDATVIIADSDDSTAESIADAIEDGNDEQNDRDILERVVNLERDVSDLRSQLWDAEGNAAFARALAEQALEETEDLAVNDEEILTAVDEADAEIIENVENAEDDEDGEGLDVDPIEPASAKTHILFRPAREFFGSRN